jgi:flagellar hook-basal body complex protein FliE
MAINAINGLASVEALKKTSGAAAPVDGSGDFGSALKGIIESLETSNGEANMKVGQMLNGTGDVHEAMLALQKADTMFQLTVQIRNKLVQAYQDVMRMSV